MPNSKPKKDEIMKVSEPIIDYLRATSKTHELPAGIEPTGEKKQHFFGYDSAEGIAINMIPAGVFMRRFEGTLIQWSGKELELLRENGVNEHQIFPIISEYRVARIDVAVDVFGLDTEKILSDWLTRWRSGDCQTRATQTRHNDVCKDEKIGSSIYLGGRSSEKMLRCYNKAIESGLDDDWLRIEMEVKGKPAYQLPGLIQQNGLQQTTRAVFDSFLQMTGIWSTIMKRLKFGILPPVKRDRTADDKFFRRVIVPYLDKRLGRLSVDDIQWMAKYVEASLTAKKV